MRYGTFELTRKPRKPFTRNKAGYIMVKEPSHPLSMKNGCVYLHRKTIHDHYSGNVSPCMICGKSLSWSDCHVDHIDEDVSNNDISNLRFLCVACNVMRARVRKGEQWGRLIEYQGEKKNAYAWVRSLGLKVTGGTVKKRLKRGMSVHDAFFSEKETHTNKENQKPKTPRYLENEEYISKAIVKNKKN